MIQRRPVLGEERRADRQPARGLPDHRGPDARDVRAAAGRDARPPGSGHAAPAGIILTGGASQLAGIAELGREVLQMPVRVAAPAGVGGLVDHAPDAELLDRRSVSSSGALGRAWRLRAGATTRRPPVVRLGRFRDCGPGASSLDSCAERWSRASDPGHRSGASAVRAALPGRTGSTGLASERDGRAILRGPDRPEGTRARSMRPHPGLTQHRDQSRRLDRRNQRCRCDPTPRTSR